MDTRRIAAGLVTVLAGALIGFARADEGGSPSRDSPFWVLADRSKSRAEALAAFRAFVGTGEPRDEARREAEQVLRVLERMAGDDVRHPPEPEPLEALPVERRAEALVRRLRDETGSDVSANGAPPSPFGGPSGPTTSADRLAALGHAAVPALLAALDRDDLTRLVGEGRGGGAPFVVRVGDAALDVVGRIAGRPFASKDACRAWWAAVQRDGEFVAAAAELERGGWLGPPVAARLQVLDAHAASPFVVLAARREKDGALRKAYLDLLGGDAGIGVEAFLRSEVTDGPDLLHGVTAAFALRDRGPFDADPLRKEWEKLFDHGRLPPSGPAEGLRTTDDFVVDAGVHQLVVFLASSGPDGVAALGRGIAERPARVRGLVAQALGADAVEYSLVGHLGRLRMRVEPPADAASAEALLRSLLRDLAPVESHYAPWGLEPRVADLAARSLARRFPERYAFDATTAPEARDAALERIRAAR